MSRAISSLVVTIIIFMSTVGASVVMYSVKQKIVEETTTQLEIVKSTKEMIVVKNAGNATASNLFSDPKAVFDPATINPGEEAVGKFVQPLYGYTVITVKSEEGSKVLYVHQSVE